MKSYLLLIIVVLFSNGFAQHINGSVVSGTSGWLFSAAEFAHYYNVTEEFKSYPLKALRTVIIASEMLAQEDIDLVVAVIPSKVSVYPEYLPEDFQLTDPLANRYNYINNLLLENGVVAPNLKNEFLISKDDYWGFPLYQKLDHHWSSLGASISANKVAQELTKLTDDLGPLNNIAIEDISFIHVSGKDMSLFKNLDSDSQTEFLEQELDNENALKFDFEIPEDREIGLFDDVAPAIVLIGDSFSDGDGRNGQWPFYSFLKYYSGHDVLNAAISGVGPWNPFISYFEGQEFIEKRPSVVIWAIWENFFEGFSQGEVPMDFIARLDKVINSDLQDAMDCKLGMNFYNKGCSKLSESALGYYQRPIDYSETNLARVEVPDSLWLSNFGIIGQNNTRWMMGPSASIGFWSENESLTNLRIDFRTPIQNQTVKVSINGKLAENIDKVPVSENVERQLSLQIVEGWNSIQFEFGNWNHKDDISYLNTADKVAINLQNLILSKIEQ